MRMTEEMRDKLRQEIEHCETILDEGIVEHDQLDYAEDLELAAIVQAKIVAVCDLASARLVFLQSILAAASDDSDEAETERARNDLERR